MFHNPEYVLVEIKLYGGNLLGDLGEEKTPAVSWKMVSLYWRVF